MEVKLITLNIEHEARDSLAVPVSRLPGKFQSVSDLARTLKLDVSYIARLIRLTLLAPDIVEMILKGEEPSGLSLNALTKSSLPAVWEEQRKVLDIT